MKKRLFLYLLGSLMLAVTVNRAMAQTPEADAKAKAEAETKAAAWLAEIGVNDPAKKARLVDVISTHMFLARDFYNSHPYTEIPEALNPSTGKMLSPPERAVIIMSTMPREIHENLMNGIRKDLTEEQVEFILDKYTQGKVQFTFSAYMSIIPDLPEVHQAEILKLLKEAREVGVDYYKNSRVLSQIFEIYKTKCELYLYQNDYNWRKYYKAYVDQRNAEKAAAGN